MGFQGDSHIGYKLSPEKPPSPKCVDPKVFLNSTVCSWDGDEPSPAIDRADLDVVRSVDDGSGLPPKLRKLSLSSQSSLSESEKGLSDGERVKEKMIVDRKKRTSDASGSSRGKKNGDRDDGDGDVPMVGVEEENAASDDPVVAVEPAVGVEPKPLPSNLMVVDKAPLGDVFMAEPKKSPAVVDEDGRQNVDKSTSSQSGQLEPSWDRRRSSRIAMAKINYLVQAGKTSGGRRRKASKKDEDLLDVGLVIISLTKDSINVI